MRENQETVVMSSVYIKSGENIHRGMYECVVIDGNGVPSIPSEGTVQVQYSGKATVHVRDIIWLIVPAILILIMIVVVLLINFLCPMKIENDEGDIYKPEDAVAPES